MREKIKGREAEREEGGRKNLLRSRKLQKLKDSQISPSGLYKQ